MPYKIPKTVQYPENNNFPYIRNFNKSSNIPAGVKFDIITTDMPNYVWLVCPPKFGTFRDPCTGGLLVDTKYVYSEANCIK